MWVQPGNNKNKNINNNGGGNTKKNKGRKKTNKNKGTGSQQHNACSNNIKTSGKNINRGNQKVSCGK